MGKDSIIDKRRERKRKKEVKFLLLGMDEIMRRRLAQNRKGKKNYSHAKKIMDFYIKSLEQDKENPQAQFSLQLAQLKLLRYKTNCLLDGLESYDIEVE